jgi:cysteinyl-tRNA synthetase
MDDDLNVSAAWGAIFEWVRDQNRAMAEGRLTAAEAAAALSAWRVVSGTLGLWLEATARGPGRDRSPLAEERQVRPERRRTSSVPT